jgi:hypothetical protein
LFGAVSEFGIPIDKYITSFLGNRFEPIVFDLACTNLGKLFYEECFYLSAGALRRALFQLSTISSVIY